MRTGTCQEPMMLTPRIKQATSADQKNGFETVYPCKALMLVAFPGLSD